MKRFLILILFSLLFPIQNASAGTSLEETIDFLINGDDDHGWYDFHPNSAYKDWSIDGCILKMEGRSLDNKSQTRVIDLNKVITSTITGDSYSFRAKCKGDCQTHEDGYQMDSWYVTNGITWKRNVKALSHLFSNFCDGAKTAF